MRQHFHAGGASSRAMAQLKVPDGGGASSVQELPAFRFHESARKQLPERYEDAAVVVFENLAGQVKSLLKQDMRIELFVSGDRGGWDESDGRRVSVRIIDANKKPYSDPCEVVRLRDSNAYDRFGAELENRIMRLCRMARYFE